MAFRQRVGTAWSVLRGTAVDFIDRASRPAPVSVITQTYGEPNAEKIRPGFEQFAEFAFGGNAVVFGVINARAKLFSEARFKFRRLSDKKLFGTDALGKLERPWPNGTTGELLTRMEQDASLAGNAYVRDCGDRLERLRPDWVTIVSWVTEDANGEEVREVLGYVYEPVGDTDRTTAYYPVEEVAHWSPIPDPMANFRGMSWLAPVLKEINADRAMTEHRDKFFRNAATPNMIIKYLGKISPSQKQGLADSIAARHGGPENAGGTLVLDEGADPLIVGSKFSDAQFDELQAAGENRIAVAGGVPAIVIGLKEGLNAAAWSMYRQAMRAFADDTMRPNWRGACASLSVLVDVPSGAELWYDTTDIAALQEGEAEAAGVLQVQAATASTLISAGFDPASVITAITAGDMTLLRHTGLVSVQLLPPGESPAGPVAPAESAAQRSTLEWALAELARAWDPKHHPRDSKGRFSETLGGRIGDALKSGASDALDGFNREQLRREAKKREIPLRRGASADEIKDALWDHHEESGKKAKAPAGLKSPVAHIGDEEWTLAHAAAEKSKLPSGFTTLADWRANMSHLSRAEQDDLLRRLAGGDVPGVHVIPVANLKNQPKAVVDAEVMIGGRGARVIRFEEQAPPPAK